MVPFSIRALFRLVPSQFRVGFLRWLLVHHGHALLPNFQVEADFQWATTSKIGRHLGWRVARRASAVPWYLGGTVCKGIIFINDLGLPLQIGRRR
jgi:hypothetical protein